MYEYFMQVTRVIDADTFEGDLDLGFGMHLAMRRGQAIKSLRVLAINAPELNTPEGQAAKARAIGLLADQRVTVRTVRMPTTDSFARYLADVILPDQSNYAALLVAEGHATYVTY